MNDRESPLNLIRRHEISSFFLPSSEELLLTIYLWSNLIDDMILYYTASFICFAVVLSLHLKGNDEIKEKIMADNVINSSHEIKFYFFIFLATYYY
jgi:hypothetical protein